MRCHISLYADDLLQLRRGAAEPMDAGEYQFAVHTGEPYLYATAEQLEAVAEHFFGLAVALRKEASR